MQANLRISPTNKGFVFFQNSSAFSTIFYMRYKMSENPVKNQRKNHKEICCVRRLENAGK